MCKHFRTVVTAVLQRLANDLKGDITGSDNFPYGKLTVPVIHFGFMDYAAWNAIDSFTNKT